MDLTIMVFCSLLIILIIIIIMTIPIINLSISRTQMKGTDLESASSYYVLHTSIIV